MNYIIIIIINVMKGVQSDFKAAKNGFNRICHTIFKVMKILNHQRKQLSNAKHAACKKG